MSKKKLIILVGLIAVSFGVSFALTSMLSKPAPQPAPSEQAGKGAEPPGGLLPGGIEIGAVEAIRPKDQQLQELVQEMRLKSSEYRTKLRKLKEREKRLEIAHGLLTQEAQDLEDLRLKLVAQLPLLKEAKAELIQTRIRIGRAESANLERLAKTYEKMDPAAGSEILAKMVSHEQEEDAVKILSFMSERSAAKLLAEIADKDLAARLCEKMKKIEKET
jgi:flagellar motility protein MotE (MotC chaperone)